MIVRRLTLLTLALATAPTLAGTFSLSSRIFVGDSDTAASEHRVLFDEGLAYDLSVIDDRFVTIYDPAAGKVLLLDKKSEVQTEVTLEELLKITAEAMASVTEPEDRKRLGIDAEVEFDDRYSIKFAGTTYVVETEKSSDTTIATAYGRFADLALRMNILRPLGPPPFARMTLNSHIAAKGEIPIRSTLSVDRGDVTDRYRSTNEIGTLTEFDRKSIDQIREQLAVFRQVPMKEFPTE